MSPPTEVAGRYVLGPRLGAGGMSTVFEARDTVLERPDSDPDGAFGRVVAAYAVALDRGDEAASAFAAAKQAAGWAPVAD